MKLLKISHRNKLDILSKEIVRDVFPKIVSGAPYNLEYTWRKHPELKDLNTSGVYFYVEYSGIQGSRSFTVSGVIGRREGYAHVIEVEIVIDPYFSEQDYQSLYYKLLNTVRHELQHASQKDELSRNWESTGPDERDKLQRIRNLVSYMMMPHEIDAFTHGNLFTAKKEKVDALGYVRDYFLSYAFRTKDKEKQESNLNNPDLNMMYDMYFGETVQEALERVLGAYRDALMKTDSYREYNKLQQ